MLTLVSFLRRRRLFTILTGASYYLAVVLLHEEVSRVSVWLQDRLTIRVYNNAVTIAGIAAAGAIMLFIADRIRRSSGRQFMLSFVVLTAVLAVASYTTLMVVNIEAIHFLQYAIVTIPIFALTLRFGDTLFWTALLGAIDEAYQYFVLKNWKYFDFNDIVLNIIGGAIGIILIFILWDYNKLPLSCGRRKWFKSPAILSSVMIAAVSFLLYASGILRAYPGKGPVNALILLSKEPPPKEFWISFKWGKTYHVLNPVEGIILSVVLVGIYYLIDYRTKTRGL